MSDRPMRLKYVTKMKIILCIFLLYITAVSVFGQSVELNGILGESVNFTAAVKIEGKLKYGTLTIGAVTSSRFSPPRNGGYSDRVQWDSSTGRFSLSGLKMEDSGVYTVENDDEPRSVSTFSLTVKVVGQSVELNGILGESVKFPAAVKIDGILMHSGVIIGEVTGGRFMPPRNGGYRDRVQWDSSTGLLSLSGLKMEDSGVYTLQDTDQNINTVFQLNVYKDNVPVSKPNGIFHNEYCTIECIAERGTGVTLFWYREGEKKPYVFSRVASAPYLHLPVPVEGSGTYTCEAKNSVSRETSDPLTVEHLCTAPSSLSAGTIAAIIIVVLIVALIAGFFAALYWRSRRTIQDIRSKHRDEKLIESMVPSSCVEIPLDNVDPHAYDDDEQASPQDESPGLSKRNDILETEKGDPPPN